LQREKAGVKPEDLSKEIDKVMTTLPSHLAGAVDAVRHIGNFAAHPIKSKSTGEVVDVEAVEAEWNLDTLGGSSTTTWSLQRSSKRKGKS
jgi:Domain of unknown function (DUF4145)